MSDRLGASGGGLDTDRVGRLIERLAATERELRELLGDDADAVITAHGETHLLQGAQKSLQHNEDVQRRAAALQRGILNALPACIALLDREGKIVLVNETWATAGAEGCFYGSNTGVGDAYIEACEEAACEEAGKEREAAEGIRAVLRGETPNLLLEYTCGQGGRKRWLRLMATPLRDGDLQGAVVMQLDITDYEIAAENLAASEERFRQAFEFAGTGMAIVGLDGTWLKANRAICQILGYTAEELAAKTFQELTHPDDLETNLSHVSDLLKGKISYYQMEKRYFHRNGHAVWCRLNVSLVRDAQGAPLHFVSQVEDINERKLAEKALRESEARLVLAQQVAGIGSWEAEIDPDAPYLDNGVSWSEQLYRIFGLEPGSVPASFANFREMVHPEDREALTSAFQEALRKSTYFTAEHRIVRPDGTVRILREEGRVFRDEHDRAVKVVGGAHDITESRIAEQERERLAVIVEYSGDAIISNDLDGIITSWNAAAERIYGYSRQEMIGQPLTRLFPVEKIQEETAVSDRLIRTLKVEQYESRRVRKDGRTIQVAVTLSPIINPAGKVVAISKIVRDITERKEAEATLETAQRRLVEASRHAGKAEVATNVLHNVGNVLNSVNISAELIERSFRNSTAGNLTRVAALLAEHRGDLAAYLSDDPQGTQIPPYLDLLAKALRDDHASARAEMASLRSNIEHIRQIIAVQQDYSRHDASETLSATAVLEDALRINAASTARHHIEVDCDCGEDISLVADKHQVLQILVNLIRNAKEALKSGSAENRKLTLQLERVGPEALRFLVIDNGVGIAPEHLGRLFEHGFTTRADGHGFGLHSAALLAAELGGSLHASSPGLGRGATFTLEIPLRDRVPA